MSVRLYGRAVGHGSLRVVTSGFAEALRASGLLAGFVALDKSSGSDEDDPEEGALAKHAVFTGALNQIHLMSRGARHEQHWVQVTPNSTYIPHNVLGEIFKLTRPRIISASAWGTEIILQTVEAMGCDTAMSTVGSGFIISTPTGKQVRLVTAHHGVSGFEPIAAEIERTRNDYMGGKFRVLHLSTTEGQRKGTLELIDAWEQAFGDASGNELLLVLDHPAKAALMERLVQERSKPMPRSVRFLPRANLDSAQMSHLLCHSHILAAPSRGEGFGLLPLQARACGVPVLVTQATGHTAGHCRGPGVVVVAHGTLAPIDDGPGALAPSVSPDSIAEALVDARGSWHRLSELAAAAAPVVQREWSWVEQLAPLTRALLENGDG